MLRDADAVLVITSLRCLTDPADINCNMCGRLTCEYLKDEEKLPDEPDVAFTGPLCVFRANNISYAIDGIVSQARNLGIDYGVYWSAGAAAMRMKIVPKDTGFCAGRGHLRYGEEPLPGHPDEVRRDKRADHERPHHQAALAPVPFDIQLRRIRHGNTRNERTCCRTVWTGPLSSWSWRPTTASVSGTATP